MAAGPTDQRTTRPVTRAAAFGTLWLFATLSLTAESWLHLRAVVPDASFPHVVLNVAQRTTLWAALAPLVLLLRRSVPLRRGHWAAGIGFHLGASCALVAALHLVHDLVGLAWHRIGLDLDPPTTRPLGRDAIDLAYYWAVYASGFLWDTWLHARNQDLRAAQLEARLRQSELKALRSQLQPHFLFNSLNAVGILIRDGRPSEASGLLTRLSSLLRASFEQHGVHELTLEREIAFLEPYIDIQRTRFGDRLAVEIQVDAAARTLFVPALLLQPLVENAFVHGLARKSGPARLSVRGWREEGRLRLQVADDGPGAPPGRHAGLTEGVGLSNTRARLAHLYGPRCSLVVRNVPGRGVTVDVALPANSTPVLPSG